MVQIRPLQSHADFAAAVDLQIAVWGGDGRDMVPSHLLLVAQKYGGVVLGAFAADRLVGMVFSFLGRASAGDYQHHSHFAAVLPNYQNQQVGYRLKLAQREAVLAQGIQVISWTYDPLESRNAALNIHKLGAICRTYLPNLYGSMNDALNAGVPSDRFSVEWHLASHHVAGCLSTTPRATFADLRAAEVPVLNPDGPALDFAAVEPLLALPKVLIAIPRDFQRLKHEQLAQAQAWRATTAQLFERAFAEGLVATDLLAAEPGSYYLLERNWKPHAH
jgi:predicted GNAT superfamily acetyltransferase